MSEDELVRIGRGGRPHGVQGAFVVEDASESRERFVPGATLLAGGEPATVVVSMRARGRPVIRLDRPVPRGTDLSVPRSALPQLDADTYYAFELVGLPVVEEGSGRELGRVSRVESGVANDVLELDTELLLPLVEDCVLDIDVEERRILVAPGFADPG